MAYEASQVPDSMAAANGASEADAMAAEPPRPGAVASDATALGIPAVDPTAESTHDDLLGELARAMHLAASSQYGRMNAELERLRTEHVEAIAARAASEVEGPKAESETDIRAIDAWAKAETEKIKLERLRRIDARREQLAVQLERQETIKQREVFAVEVAIDGHRHEIDAFFGRMEREADPATIAQVASTLPALPALTEIADHARRGAVAEFAALGSPSERSAQVQVSEAPTGEEQPSEEPSAASDETGPEATVGESAPVPVMDPELQRGDAESSQPWEAPYAVMVAAGSVAADAPPEPESPSRLGSTLLRTVRAIRPMAGERHDRSGRDR